MCLVHVDLRILVDIRNNKKHILDVQYLVETKNEGLLNYISKEYLII